MRRTGFVCLLVVLLVAGFTPAVKAEPEPAVPFGFSVFHPVQVPEANSSITGVRFNLFFAVNKNVTGLDIGLLFPVNFVRNDFNGIQLGVYNRVGNNAQGLQLGAVNLVRGHFTGLQTAFYNQADSVNGFQVGLVNITRKLSGAQVGLANIKGEPGSGWPREVPHRFFPIVNWTF